MTLNLVVSLAGSSTSWLIMPNVHFLTRETIMPPCPLKLAFFPAAAAGEKNNGESC